MRTRPSTVLPIALALALAVPAAQSGQAPPDPQAPAPRSSAPEQPVFRAGTSLVRVDMFATRDGAFVGDLRADDVEVFEDGVRQRIETFERVRVADAAASAEPAGGTAGDDGRSRVFVVFIDTFTTQLENEPALRLSLVRFLDRLLGPSDLVGLMTPEMSAHDVVLGHRATVISDVANDLRWIRRDPSQRTDLREFGWENCYPSRGGPSSGRIGEMKARRRAKVTLEALQNLVGHLRELREERKAVLVVTAGWPFLSSDTVLQSSSRTETAACAADRLALLRTDYRDLLRDLARSANRANVSFYPVNSRRQLLMRDVQTGFRNGVPINAAMIVQRDRRMFELSHAPLRSLAEDTDGQAEPGIASLDRLTDRIVADTSEYYLIGYQSTNPRADGRFRSIEVKVHREGVRVRARPGYGGEPPPLVEDEATAPRAPVVDSRVTLALEAVERFDTAAPVWLRTAAWGGGEEAGGGAFWFIGEVGAVRSQPAWSGGAVATVEVLDPARASIVSRTFDLDTAAGAFALRVPGDGTIPAGDYTVRVRLAPHDEDGHAVHDTVRVRVDAGTPGSGAAVLWRRGPSSRLEYLQTADPRFRRNERLRLELPTDSDSDASARLLDRLGHALQVPTQVSGRADASGEFDWIVIDAPVAGLAPGDYAIEVTQDGAAQVTAFRIVP
jgi:VWFA-related protein